MWGMHLFPFSSTMVVVRMCYTLEFNYIHTLKGMKNHEILVSKKIQNYGLVVLMPQE